MGKDLVDDAGQRVHVTLVQAALGNPGSADANAVWLERTFVTGDSVFVEGDAAQIKNLRSHLTTKRGFLFRIEAPKIAEQQVRLRSAVRHLDATRFKRGDQCFCIRNDAFGKVSKFRRAGNLERHCPAGDVVDVRPSLFARKNSKINLLRIRSFGRQDDRASRAAQSLVGGKRGDIRDADRIRINATNDQSGVVGHIRQQDRAHFICNGSKFPPVYVPRVRAVTRYHHPGLVLYSQIPDLFITDPAGVLMNPVRNNIKVFAGPIDRAPMRQVSAMCQIHTHDRIARRYEGFIYSVVGSRAGKWLDVDIDLVNRSILIREDFSRTPHGKGLNEVGILAAFVEAAIGVAPVIRKLVCEIRELILIRPRRSNAGIALGVQIGEFRAHGLSNRGRAQAL